jgi:deazaflavin-dependent oxidoreductase (nitroreductase family)
MSDPGPEPPDQVPPPIAELLRPRIQHGVQVLAGHSLNRAAVGMLRLGLPFPPYGPESALVLETFGRVTGKRRLTPMGCLREGERLLVVAEHGRRADWVRNALAGGTVRLWLAGRPYQARVGILDPSDPGGDPEILLERMGNKIHAATVRTMAHEPCVVRFALES